MIKIYSNFLNAYQSLLVSALICLALPGVISAQTNKFACSPQPAVEKVLQQVTDLQDEEPQVGFDPVKKKKLSLLADSLKKFPADLFLHEMYQDLMNQRPITPYHDEITAEYLNRMKQMPDDPVSHYLYGRSLMSKKTDEAINHMQMAGQLPQAKLRLAEIYLRPNTAYYDQAKGQSQLKEFWSSCPDSMAYVDSIFPQTGKETIVMAADRLRKQLEESRNPLDFARYSRLWFLERQNAPPNEAKQRLESDLKRLREMNLVTESGWYSVLLAGYQQSGKLMDASQTIDLMSRNLPKSYATLRSLDQKIHVMYRTPDGSTPPDKASAYYQGIWQESGKLLERWPLDIGLWADRVEGALGQPELSDAEFLATIDGWQKAADKNTENGLLGLQRLQLFAPIAEVYMRRNIRVNQIPQLIDAAFKASERYFKPLMQLDTMPAQQKSVMSLNSRFTHWHGWIVLSKYFVKIGQLQKAREMLESMHSDYVKIEPGENILPRPRIIYSGFNALYLEGRGRLAEAENRKLDAMIHYQNAINFLPKEMVGQYVDRTYVEDIKARVDGLWKELGGTSEGKAAWVVNKP